MIEITQLHKDDIVIVNQLAHEIWPYTFRDILSKDQISYMLDWMYSLETLQEQVQTGYIYFLAKLDGIAVGFLGLEPNFPDENQLRIHKIYVKPNLHKKGIGRALLNHTIDIAFDLDQTSLHLNVNKFNDAVGFYKHVGFNITKEENIDIGKGYLMEDFVMELKLK
jgi:GNAT superfamily N-acetyltransferase